MILLVDNYDSFTYNLAHLFGALGAQVVVLRNDEPGLERLEPFHLLFPPRPGWAPPRSREGRDGPPRRPRPLPRPAGDVRGRPLPLARRDARAGGARGVRELRRGRGDGGAAPRAADRR